MTRRTGRYIYERDGVRVAHEDWTIESRSDGLLQVRSSRDASQFGSYLCVEAIVSQLGNGDGDYRFVLARSKDGPILKSSVYRIRDGKIAARTISSSTVAKNLRAKGVFFPLLRVFTGAAIRALEKLGGEGSWCVPSISNLNDKAIIFAPETTHRRVQRAADVPLAYWLEGGPYETPARVQLRPDGMLDRYEFVPKGSSEVWLCRYDDDAEG